MGMLTYKYRIVKTIRLKFGMNGCSPSRFGRGKTLVAEAPGQRTSLIMLVSRAHTPSGGYVPITLGSLQPSPLYDSFGAGRLTTIEEADVVRNGTGIVATSGKSDGERIVFDQDREVALKKMLFQLFR